MFGDVLSSIGSFFAPSASGGQSGFGNLFNNVINPLAQQASQAQREQDLYNVMPAAQASQIINQNRQQAMQQEQFNQNKKQTQALRELLNSGALDSANPMDFMKQVATITGDLSPLVELSKYNMGMNRPAVLQVADAYMKGDPAYRDAIAMSGKFFDKGVLPYGGGDVTGINPNAPSPLSGYSQTGGFVPPKAQARMEGLAFDDIASGGQGLTTPLPMDVWEGVTITDSPNPMPPPPSSGGFGVPAGYAESVAAIDAQKAAATEQAKLQEQLRLKPEIAAAETTAQSDAKYMAEGRQSLPKAQRALSAAQNRAGNIGRIIDKSREQAQKAFTTGFTGSISSAVAGTPAYDLAENLKTLRATAAFDTLQNMRDNSPTGGALGQVSNIELGLLESAYSNLQNSQSQEQFLENLAAFERQHQQALAAMQAAYEQDYARFGGGMDSNLPEPNRSQPKRLVFNPATGDFQ